MKSKFKLFATNTLGGMLLHFFLALVVIVSLAMLFFFVYLPKTTNHLESITVPNVEGMKLAQLEDFLVKKDLRFEVSDSSYSAKFPPLTVLKQFPQAGAKVKEGRKIFITINQVEPPSVPVPDLVDGSVINADAVLASNELRRGKVELVPGPFNVVKEMKIKGTIVKEGTRVPKGSVIDLVVMDGGNRNGFPIEDLTNYELEDARVYALGVNLGIRVYLEDDTTGSTPVVVKQKPLPGENIKVGDVVELWVSKESKPEDEE